MAQLSQAHLAINQHTTSTTVTTLAPSLGVSVQAGVRRQRDHGTSVHAPVATRFTPSVSVRPTTTAMTTQTTTRPPMPYLPPPTPTAPSRGVPSYTPPILPTPRKQQAMVTRPAGSASAPTALSCNAPNCVTTQSYTSHPPGPPRQLSYVPPPVTTQQGVASYTPPPVLNQASRFQAAEDRTIAFMPLFAIKDAEPFIEACNRCIEKVKSETLCLGYGFALSAGPEGDMAFCRESYVNAEGVIEHLHNIEVLFNEGLCRYGQLVSLQIHGPKEELHKLRQHPIIQELCPQFYELMPGAFEVIELPMQHGLEVSPLENRSSGIPVRKQASEAKIDRFLHEADPVKLMAEVEALRQQANVVIGSGAHAAISTSQVSEDRPDRLEFVGRTVPTTYKAPPFH